MIGFILTAKFAKFFTKAAEKSWLGQNYHFNKSKCLWVLGGCFIK